MLTELPRNIGLYLLNIKLLTQRREEGVRTENRIKWRDSAVTQFYKRLCFVVGKFRGNKMDERNAAQVDSSN
jgi:hypothetical protein